MSPREKHIPNDAQRTSICLTAEDRAAIHWIDEVRRRKRDRRTTTNDILIDSLWFFLEKTEGMTKDQIRAMIPTIPIDNMPQNKVTEMPRAKNRR